MKLSDVDTEQDPYGVRSAWKVHEIYESNRIRIHWIIALLNNQLGFNERISNFQAFS